MFITVRDIKKSFGSEGSYTLALKGVSLDIEQGEIVVIIGPSGGGKSTLLNSLGGLTEVDEGTIEVDGALVSDMNQKQLADYREDKLGFIFQFYNLIPDLTVAENVQVCENLSDDPLDMIEILQVLGIAHLRDRFPSELSGGQQQRAAIARALVKNPAVLLCDEPTGALDSASSKDILEMLDEVNQRYGTTILMVTHNEEITRMAHRNIAIKDGQIVSDTINHFRIPAKDLDI